MIEPTLAKIIVVLVLLAMLGGLLTTAQAILDPAEARRREREERRRKKELDRKMNLYGCLFLLALPFVCVGISMVGALFHVVFTPDPAPAPPKVAEAPASAPLPAPLPHAPLVEGRPENLRGLMADGCTLLSAQEASARVGRPLIFDVISLADSRDESVHCAYVDRFVRHPQRPKQEVSVMLVSKYFSVSAFGPQSAPAAEDPEGLRAFKPRGDEGVWVTLPTSHGLLVVVNVVLRHLKDSPGKRASAERTVARQLALMARERAPALPETALRPPPWPEPPGTESHAWFPRSRSDLVYQDGPTTERTYWAVRETLARLRADFGTRVKVVVLDEDEKGPAWDPEALARAVEGAFEVGRGDTSPRRDGALVLVDLASHRAWFFFGPGAPALTRAGKRPFPQEWHGKDLTLKGPGVVTRVKALAAAYTQAYRP